MVRDVASVARYLDAEVVVAGREAAAPVDAVIGLSELAVIAHPRFVTLVTATADDALAALGEESDRGRLLRETVLVTHAGDARIRAAVADAGVTAIVGARPDDELLHPLLTALLAVDRAAEERAVTSAMRVLTLAARRSGVAGVVAELAHRIDGWVVLLDRHGEVITTAGAGSLHIRDAVAVAFGRPVRVRHRELQVHPVGASDDIDALLVTAPRNDASGRGRELASQTAALLDLVLRTDDPSRTERLGRSVLIDGLIEGGAVAASILHRWGIRERTLTGFVLTARTSSVDLERLVALWFTELAVTHVFTERSGSVIGFVRDDLADALAARVAEYSLTLFLGIGSPAPVETLDRTAGEARQAVDVAGAEGRRVVRYESISTIHYLFERLDTATTRRIAHLLDPLGEDGAEGGLTQTLRVFLAENGAWGVSASRLGIHRQTLAARIRRIEELTGLSMTDADDRAAAWLALRAMQR
ncbi:PucR family transcriptional regulator [Microbacterium sp. ASV49]|uniref:Helix-turn-helix domain-containing protein n=1 Tax=Microbacterium candidum TaxID=3041922 RepID=A0ABT7MV98_9MICO|nr:PucR family transcriptional regulator [Microbacterium sp. ASV49]MDL9978381.1 helix-turn-helix domain-containing protein [Microbacterium sp. ASV49]